MSNPTNTPVAYISISVQKVLEMPAQQAIPVYLGETNINHMIEKHENDFATYHNHIPQIINTPDYVAKRTDGSIEFIKEFKIDNKYVKVAVRVSSNNKYFARTLYTINSNRVRNFILNGKLTPI